MNRKYWLEQQIKTNNWKSGVELGVLRGPTFKHLSTCNKEYTHYGVDVFVNDRHWRSHNITTTEEILDVPAVEWYKGLEEFAKENNSILIRDFSHLAASRFEDEEFDYVFIDAGHRFEDVVKDMNAWIPKVKKGGMISGHDINMLDVKMAVTSINLNYDIGPDNIWYYMKGNK